MARTRVVFVMVLVLVLVHAGPAPAAASSRRWRHGQHGIALLSQPAEQAAAVGAAAVPAESGQEVAAAAAAACASPSLEWPAGSGFCWTRRDSNNVAQGPGNNVFKAANAWVNAADQLIVQIIKDSRKKFSCGEVFLDRSLGLGDYVWVIETDPALIHANLVASGFIYASDVNEFDVEFSRWAQPTIENSQYVIQPYTTSAPSRFNVSATRLTHRIRWAGSNSPSDVLFETFNEAGALIKSWVGQAGNNFQPGNERVHLNHWIYQASNKLPDSSTFVVNCFSFCALGQACATPQGVKPPCGPGAAAIAKTIITQPSSNQGAAPTPPAAPVSPPPAPATPPPTGSCGACADGAIRWPANSVYCWYPRDSAGAVQGPGASAWSSKNAFVASTGQLVLRVVAPSGSQQPASAGVFLQNSLGFGEYIWVTQTDPAMIDVSLVGGLALYLDGSHSFAYEFARWGQPSIENSQFVMQPYDAASNPPARFNVSAQRLTHRLRWAGGDSPSQVTWETFNEWGALLKSWTGPAGGNNFMPGGERIHINHWVFQAGSSNNLGAAGSSFVLNCFKFVPLGQEATSAPLGQRPGC